MGKRFQVAVGRKKTDVKTRLGVRGAAKKPQGAAARLSGTAARSKPQPKSSIDGKWTHDLFASTLRSPKAVAGPSRGGRGAVRAVPVMTTRGGGGGVAKTSRRQPLSTRLSSEVVGGRGARLASVVVTSPAQRRAVSRAVTVRVGPLACLGTAFSRAERRAQYAQSGSRALLLERARRLLGAHGVQGRVTTQITTGRGGGGGAGQGDVGGLLGSLGLAKYKGLFAREEVDMAALSCMTDSDLQLMGIPMGPRKKILNSFQ